MAKQIMVFNDAAEILELFNLLLAEEGYKVSLHSYSTRDIDQVKKVMPDLIISDHLTSDEKQGWQFLQKLKMTHQTAKIPLIICTTDMKVVKDAEGRFAEKGVLLLPKPFDIEELLQMVEDLIGKAHEPGVGKTSLNPQNKGDASA